MSRAQKSGRPRRKLYTLAAVLIADDLVRQVNEIDAAEWYLLHRIGYPVGQPQIIEMRVRLAASASLLDLRPHIEEIAIANFRAARSFRG